MSNSHSLLNRAANNSVLTFQRYAPALLFVFGLMALFFGLLFVAESLGSGAFYGVATVQAVVPKTALAMSSITLLVLSMVFVVTQEFKRFAITFALTLVSMYFSSPEFLAQFIVERPM